MVVGEFTQETDLLIIGGGPAGYSAAFRAAELGVQTIIVDSRDALGGVCLHDGCVPSKTLLHIAETISAAQQANDFGVSFGKPKIDSAALRSWRAKAVSKLALGLDSLCKKHGVERLQGQAHFEDSRHVALLDAAIPRIRFRRALIATGSQPKVHPDLAFDGKHILTAGESLALDDIPASLLIVGNDYMAVETATIFASLGAAVTIAFEGDQLLPDADADLVRPLVKRLQPLLSAMHSNATVSLKDIKKDKAHAVIGDSKPVAFDRVVVTAGHIGNTRGLHLEHTKAQVNADSFIAIDQQMRTHDPRLFAAGDVTGHPCLADKALHQGRIAAEVIAGRNSVYEPRMVPHVIFTDPQLAWCGMTERESSQIGVDIGISKVPWGASGRAVGMGRQDGVTKILFDRPSQLVLGVGIVGPQAAEMIAEGALAMEMGATLTDLAETIHPHPTMSELISDAARAALGTS